MIFISRIFLILAVVLLPLNHLKLIYNFSISDLFFSFTFAFIIAFQINNKISFKSILSTNDFILPLYIYTMGFLISANNSFDPIESIFSYMQIFFIFIVIYYAFSFHSFSESFVKKILYILAITSTLITLSIFLFFITGKDYSFGFLLVEKGWGMVRFSYGSMEPNITARIMAQSIPVLILFTFEKKNLFIKIFNGILILLLLSVIVLTASRSGLIILLVGGLCYLIFHYRYKRQYNIFKIIFSTLLFTSLLFFIYHSFPDLFEGSVQRYSTILNPSTSASSKERLLILEKSFKIINEHPIIGNGLGNSHNITGASVHNSIVITWLENGFFGFLGFLMIYLIIIYYAIIGFKNRFFNNGVLMVLCVVSIMMITGDMFMANSYKRTLWVPVILFVVYSKQLIRTASLKNEFL